MRTIKNIDLNLNTIQNSCIKKLKNLTSLENSVGLFKVIRKTKFGVTCKLLNLTESDDYVSLKIEDLFFSLSNLDLDHDDVFLGTIRFKSNDPQAYVEANLENLVLKKCSNCEKSYYNISSKFPYKYSCVYCDFQDETYSGYKKPENYSNMLLFY